MRRRAALALLPVLALAACGGGDTTSEDERGGNGTEVAMRLIAYKPDKLTISANTKVTWLQQDAGAHTVTSGVVKQEAGGVSQQPDGRFDSGDVAKGGSFSFTFTEPGTYTYYCSLHPATMRGEVTVT